MGRRAQKISAAVIAAELLAQADMVERGRRLQAFKAATEGRRWVYDENIGQHRLERVFSNVADYLTEDRHAA